MYRWNIQSMELPLSFLWKISRGSSTSKKLFFIEVESEGFKAKGEVAAITKNESQPIEELFESFQKQNISNIEDIENLNILQPLKFGLTSALTHLQCKMNNKSLTETLEINDNDSALSSFALPILETKDIKEFIDSKNLTRFPFLKVKVADDNAVEICNEVSQHFKGPLRIDANEAFKTADDVLRFFDQIKDLNIEFIEQPMPRDQFEEMIKVKSQSPFLLIADESIQTEIPDESWLQSFDGINVKLMKSGSYQLAVKQIKTAQQIGLKTMIGCMVETSLGIAGALALGHSVNYFDLDGFLYFKDEPFQYVTENKGLITYQQNKTFPLD